MRPRWLGGRAAEPQIAAHFLKDGGASALARWRSCAAQASQTGMSALQNAQLADIATWLPADLLLKLDRCLMAHGLEGRTPFLDRAVTRFAFSLPDRMKVRGRHGKWLLRKWLEHNCPAAEPWARKKGFTVPVAAWIAPRAADLGPSIAATALIRDLCDPDAVRAVFQDAKHSAQRWPLLFTALWSLIHIEDVPASAALGQLIRPM
jgi:asparagine synthase (glutamine-hydrolysing)